uniref:Uncharacterized protein n=1 Tax=Tanacetum cinerariifolium TaxID=118510 RepID=A0A6L2NSE4_TANCI|nr:hypothetical protein [Tanacetum cinerariifolium]
MFESWQQTLPFLWTWLSVLLYSVLSLFLDQDLAIGNGGLPPYLLHFRGLLSILRTLPFFDVALRSSLERIVTAMDQDLAIGNGGLPPYLSHLGGLVSILHPIFDDALSVFNTSMETYLLSNPSEIAAPKLMKKITDIYFTRVTKIAESTFSLAPRQMALWTSQRDDHTSDSLRTVSISGLGQTTNSCSRVFAGDIYGDHAVSCVGIIDATWEDLQEITIQFPEFVGHEDESTIEKEEIDTSHPATQAQSKQISDSGDGVSTLCILYNATSETLYYDQEHSWYGRVWDSYPMEL